VDFPVKTGSLIELVVLPSCTCPRSVYGVITKAASSFADPELLSIIETFLLSFHQIQNCQESQPEKSAVHQHYSSDFRHGVPSHVPV